MCLLLHHPLLQERYLELYWQKNLNFGGGNNGCNDIVGNPGIDINQNFKFKWGDLDGLCSDLCMDDYHGLFAKSKPKTWSLAEYAKGLFPVGQQREDPKGDIDILFGKDITGVYLGIHASGGYGELLSWLNGVYVCGSFFPLMLLYPCFPLSRLL